MASPEDTRMTKERVKPNTPDLPQTHPGHDAAWASYWQEKSRWQDQEIEQLRADISQAYDLRDKTEGRYCTALGQIEKLRAALQTILDLSDSAMRDGDGARDVARAALGNTALEPRVCRLVASPEQLLGTCLACGVTFQCGAEPASREASSLEVVAHSKSQQRRFDAQGVKWGEPESQEPSISQKMAAAGYTSRRIPREDAAEPASREAAGVPLRFEFAEHCGCCVRNKITLDVFGAKPAPQLMGRHGSWCTCETCLKDRGATESREASSAPIVCRKCGSTDTMPWPQSPVTKSEGGK